MSVIQGLTEKRKVKTVAGIQSSYYILRTDYSNYLLTYQCTRVLDVGGVEQIKGLFYF